MEAAFAQSIIQFANLRVFARGCAFARVRGCAHTLIHDLFPKARFAPSEEKTHDLLFEVAWSFLARPTWSNKVRIFLWHDQQEKLHLLGANYACFR